MTVDEFLDRLEGVHTSGNGWMAICPSHEDYTASMSVTEDERGIGFNCFAGCDRKDILDAMGLEWNDVFYQPLPARDNEPEAIYEYTDEIGQVLFQTLRLPGKKFRQRHYAPESEEAKDGWVWNLEGIRRVLFRLPRVLEARGRGEPVFVCEGEKDVMALEGAGVVATCNPLGAGKWREEYNETLAGTLVIIVQDKDEVGRTHARRVKEELLKVGATVRVVQAAQGKDAHDHIAAGFTPDQFLDVKEKAHRGVVTAREMAERAMLHLVATPETEPEFIVHDFGLPTGLRFRQGRLYTLGGYTGDGKTNTALQVTRRYLEGRNGKLGFFTYEMSEEDLRNRLIAHNGLPLFDVERPFNLNPEQRHIYELAVQEIADWDLEIVYDTSLPAEGIADHTYNQEYDFIVVDHIHELPWGRERRNLEEEIRRLKNLALEFNIPVLVLAQLRRYERGKGFQHYPEPTLQDFRETEILGTTSAMAMVIWRERDQAGKYLPNHASKMSVLKDRYGPVGGSLVRFNPDTMMFDTGAASDGILHGGGESANGELESYLDPSLY